MGALFSAGLVGIPTAIGLCFLLSVQGFLQHRGKQLPIGQKLWKLISLSAFALAIIATAISGSSLGENGLILLLYLLVNRFEHLRTPKDGFQLYLINLMCIVLSAIFSFDLSFLAYFLGFLALSLACLATLNMQWDAEDLAAHGLIHRGLERSAVRRLFPLACGAVLALALIIFFGIPRVGFGYFNQDRRRGPQMSGFSDEVSLGEIGTIQEDQTVAFRVEFPGKKPETSQRLYFRGSSFDHYDGKRWSKSATGREYLTGRLGEPIAISPCPRNEPMIEQRYLLEPFDSDVIFALEQPCSFRFSEEYLRHLFLRELSIQRDGHQSLTFGRRLEANRSYAIVSQLNWTDPNPPVPTGSLPRYLQIYQEKRTLRALAQRIINGSQDVTTAAMRMQSHFSREFSYTLQLEAPQSSDPIESFLLNSKRGHCEYFATSMAILLRYVGIPTRLVTGFAGGDWNEVGNYLLVRQQHAHTWIEAYDKQRGWLRFDPTPASVRFRNADMPFWVKQYDYLRLRWEKYVLYYSLQDQRRYIGALRSFTFGGMKQFSALRDFFGPHQGSLLTTLRGEFLLPAGIGIALFFGLLLFLARRALFHRRREELPRIYHDILSFLAKRGYSKRTDQTLGELLQESAVFSPADTDFIVALYQRASFGGETPSLPAMERLHRIMRTTTS